MQCPHDATVLQMTERQGVEIDYCPTCRGVWLDRGELDKILERVAGESRAEPPPPPPPANPAYDPRTESVGYGRPVYPSQPRYGGSPKSPDSPDYRHGQPGYGQPAYGQPGYDPRYDNRRRKKNFLNELFDF